jgi:hypothetical protein
MGARRGNATFKFVRRIKFCLKQTCYGLVKIC